RAAVKGAPGQGRALQVRPGQLLDDGGVMLDPVGRDLAVAGGEEGGGRVGRADRLGDSAVPVERPGDADQLPHQVGTPDGGEQGDHRPVADPQEPGRATHDPLEEGDGVVGHQVEAGGTVDVGRVAVAAPLRGVDVEVAGEHLDGGRQGPGVDEPRVEDDEG